MSRLGKKAIDIPSGVTVTVTGSAIDVKGPKGNLAMQTRPEVAITVTENKAKVDGVKETRETSAYIGLTWSLLNNMIKGVSTGFEKKLELVGVGYRVKAIAGGASLSVGYSHPVDFIASQGITIDVIDTQNIVIKGADKQVVGQTAAQIRKVRKPEPYKGKGIKYTDEVVRRKVGKSGKV